LKKHSGSILVVSNGVIATAKNNRLFVNGHSGRLLLDLKEDGFEPTYVGLSSIFDQNSNLLDFELGENNLRGLALKKTNLPHLVKSLFIEILSTRFVYIFYPGSFGFLVAFMCLLLGKSYGLYVRGERYDSGFLSRVILRLSRFVLTVSPSIEKRLQSFCDHVETIRPMTFISEKDGSQREELISVPSIWNILFVGSITVHKGIYELLKAAAELKKEGINFNLRLVGGGVLFDHFEDQKTGHSDYDNIEFVGLISDKDALMAEYRKAHLFILPTYHEGFPRVLYEAMITELPIITTMVGGIPGRMTDLENCVAIEARSSKSIVNAVKLLTKDLDLYNNIGKNGHDTVTKVLRNNKSHNDLLRSFLEQYVK
jgi:glycosyltransferase involved in cell wall biosynthesis